MEKNNKIKIKTTIVEMDGDEMTRVMWQLVKEKLLLPHLDLNVEYYDLHLKHRDETNDEVTAAAAAAINKYGVGVKCATITATPDRVREYNLKRQSKSPNAIIRGILDGTVFRSPIMVKNIVPIVSSWKKPIIIGRHAYGDVYGNVEMYVQEPGKVELVYTASDGAEDRKLIHPFDGPGIIQGIHNTDASIASFARACFSFAYDQRIDLWLSVKDTISKTYDGRFRDIFAAEFERYWRDKFSAAGIEYFYTLIDDAASRILRTEGGIIWALKNYDGDTFSDLVASGFGSLAMMTSVLVSPTGKFEYEAAHGTVQRHYYKHLRGEETSSNSMALIFTWTGGLRKRGELDGTPAVIAFAEKMEAAARETVEAGIMTGDLLPLAIPSPANRKVNTEEFLDAVAARLKVKLCC